MGVAGHGVAGAGGADRWKVGLDASEDSSGLKLLGGGAAHKPIIDGDDGEESRSIGGLSLGTVVKEALVTDERTDDGLAADSGVGWREFEGEGIDAMPGFDVFSSEVEELVETELLPQRDVFSEDHEPGFIGVGPGFAVESEDRLVDGADAALRAENDWDVRDWEGRAGDFSLVEPVNAFGEDDEIWFLDDGFSKEFADGVGLLIFLDLGVAEGLIDPGLKASDAHVFSGGQG